ncbi:MAG: hypothetical protein ACTHL3_08705 [Candidatus Nitrosocosmicus sp.]
MSISGEFISSHGHSIAFANDKHIDDNKNSFNDFEPLYKIVHSYLAFGYAVIYGAESFQGNAQDEMARISNQITKSKMTFPIKNNIDFDHNCDIHEANKAGSFVIIDAEASYDKNYDDKDILNYWYAQFSNIAKNIKEKKIKGIFGINSPEPYLSKNRYKTFIGFEKEMGKELAGNLAFLCWYKGKRLENLKLSELLDIVISHENILHDNFQFDKFHTEKILKIISKIIDKDAGASDENNETSTLLFETIRHRYKIDRESLASNPMLLEQVLSKTLGNDNYYYNIQPTILREIKKEILFDNISPDFSSLTSTKFDD